MFPQRQQFKHQSAFTCACFSEELIKLFIREMRVFSSTSVLVYVHSLHLKHMKMQLWIIMAAVTVSVVNCREWKDVRCFLLMFLTVPWCSWCQSRPTAERFRTGRGSRWPEVFPSRSQSLESSRSSLLPQEKAAWGSPPLQVLRELLPDTRRIPAVKRSPSHVSATLHHPAEVIGGLSSSEGRTRDPEHQTLILKEHLWVDQTCHHVVGVNVGEETCWCEDAHTWSLCVSPCSEFGSCNNG